MKAVPTKVDTMMDLEDHLASGQGNICRAHIGPGSTCLTMSFNDPARADRLPSRTGKKGRWDWICLSRPFLQLSRELWHTRQIVGKGLSLYHRKDEAQNCHVVIALHRGRACFEF